MQLFDALASSACGVCSRRREAGESFPFHVTRRVETLLQVSERKPLLALAGGMEVPGFRAPPCEFMAGTSCSASCSAGFAWEGEGTAAPG